MTQDRMPRRVLVVQHEEGTEVDWVGEWLTDEGFELDVLRGHHGTPVPDTLADHDALVVLGGSMGAMDDDEHTWLASTRTLIADTVEADRPFLGICLGHQLAAIALGGSVGRNPRGYHRGIRPVALTAPGSLDPLFTGLDGAPAVHFNQDVVTTPPSGATVLATLPDGPVQALRFGPRAWGVQFHPETSPAMFEQWLAEHTDLEPDQAAAEVAAVAAEDARLQRAWRTLTARFADVVRSARAG